MKRHPPLVVLALGLLALTALHSPQPLLPSLAGIFQRSPADVALLMTVTLAPLGIIPVAYGYLLEGVSTKSLLYFSVFGIALTEFWLWMFPDYFP